MDKKMVNHDFFKNWSPTMAYVLGFIAADGNVMTNSRGGSYLSIEIIDKELLLDIKEALESKHKVSERVRGLNCKKSFRLQIGSVEIYKDLKGLGITENKSKNLGIHFKEPHFFPDFLRGYFDGDGNIWCGDTHKNRKNKNDSLLLSFTSGSQKFLKSILSNLRLFGISGGYIYSSKKGYGRLTLSTHDALKIYKIMYNGKVKLFLERKKLVFENFIKMRV